MLGPKQATTLASLNAGKVEMGKIGVEWTGKVEIRKVEISGCRRSMHGYILSNSVL